MRRMLVSAFAAFAGLAGWVGHAGAGLFSSTGPVIAILAGDLYLGEAEGNLDGSGTLTIQSRAKPDVTCLGQFTFSDELGDVGDMRCSNGATAVFQFQRLSLVRGYGTGSSTRGPMSFTYGLSADESAPYLKLPPGKALGPGGKDLVLVDARQPDPANFRLTASIEPAPEAAPDALLSAATLVVTASLKQDRDRQTGSRGKIVALVESTILPLFDFRHMTQLAVAANWRLASPEQRNALETEFRTLLVRTYSAALAGYRDQAIEYKPLRMAPSETEVTVKSTVWQPGAERMTIDYDMEKTAAGWKVYDIKVAGISLITTYRSSFAQVIRDGGVDGLVKALSAKNLQADSGAGGARAR